MKIGNKEFDFCHNTYVMGILNVTEDSFSDGGTHNTLDKALAHTEKMLADGADIIDVGGESTRPGYTKISEQEEIERVIPVIEKIRENFDVAISVDTYKAKVAKESIFAGAHLVNDIWGLKADQDMAKVIAEGNVACCLMHNRDRENNPYTDFIQDVLGDLRESLDMAKEAGIPKELIITDPGVGFGKTYEENLIITNHVEELHKLGCPILLGTSRKSMIGLTLNLPVDQREEGTVATTVLGVMKGCGIVRVHDVLANKRAIMMTEAILKSR